MMIFEGLRHVGERTCVGVFQTAGSFLYVIRANCQGELVPEGSGDP